MRVFGKEHPGYVRDIGIRVTISEYTKSTSHSTSSTSSSESNGKIEKMHAEINELKKQVSEYYMMKEQIAFLMQNARRNHVK